MSKQTIAVDVDEVLAPHAAEFVAYSNQKYGTNLTVDDYTEHWSAIWNSDYDTTAKRAKLFSVTVFPHLNHFEDADAVLRKLSKKYNLVVVTARRSDVKDITTDWINAKYPGIFKDIHFAGIWDKIDHSTVHATKKEICQAVGADYLIDDQLKHCIGAAEAGIQALLFGDYAWNQAETLSSGVTRCVDWVAVEEYFDAVKIETGFRERVEAIVAQIPKGRVMTYGQLAALCGNARAARIVGGIAHFGNPDLPWQRVVNKQGGLASGYPGGRAGHAAALRAEGFNVSDDFAVDVQQLLWWPKGKP